MFERTYPLGAFSVGFVSQPLRHFHYYAEGYYNAAIAVVQKLIKDQKFPDYDAYPAVFLFRHSLELHLKACIYNSKMLAYFMQNETLDCQLRNTHNLTPLAGAAKNVTDALFPDDQELAAFMNQVIKMAEALDQLDAGSFSFRYPIKKNGEPAFEKEVQLSIIRIAEELEPIHSGLNTLHFGIELSEQIIEGLPASFEQWFA